MSKSPKFLRLHWADQITANPKKTADFYSDLLGFTQRPCDEGEGYTSYSMTDDAGKDIFGVVEEAVFPNWARGWVMYFEVEDFEAQCQRIESLGGEIILRGKQQCLFKDPAGSPCVLVRTNATTPSTP